MTATARTTRMGPAKAQAFYSFVVNIPDDEAYSFTPPATYGHIFLSSVGSANHGFAWFRGSSCTSLASGSGFATSTSALTGTTGTDGQLTLGSASNVLYIENRTGAEIDLAVTVLTFDNVVD